MKKILKRIFNGKMLIQFIFWSLALSVVFVTVRMILAPTTTDDPSVRVKSDYVLSILQCCVGVAAMLLPDLLRKRLRISVPSKMIIAYALFLYCAIYLGEVRSFYFNVPHWDVVLHVFSGSMLGALGFSVITFLNKADRIPMNLSPIFVVFFSFCFAVTMGVVWEFYEFIADGLLGTNMQKFALEGGEALVGREALTDTMKDLFVDAIGAGIISVFGYISLKHKKGWLEKIQLKAEYDIADEEENEKEPELSEVESVLF